MMTAPSAGAIVLLSGGLDSAVTALAAVALGYEVHGLSFEYGQRHEVELRYAARLAEDLGFRSYRTQKLACFEGAASALIDHRLEVPKRQVQGEVQSGRIPITYVPARNTIFLSHALGWCEQLGLSDIFIGVNSLDYSGYPDCRPEFLRAFEGLGALATRAAVEAGRRTRIRAPLLHRSKAEIVRLGAELKLDFSKTWSCYDPVLRRSPDDRDLGDDGSAVSRSDRGGALACGVCDSCVLRLQGFRDAGIEDPAPYRRGMKA
jgi:7-cyano-7-deazaguanine synthase